MLSASPSNHIHGKKFRTVAAPARVTQQLTKISFRVEKKSKRKRQKRKRRGDTSWLRRSHVERKKKKVTMSSGMFTIANRLIIYDTVTIH